ncbi:hypothetical protein KIN20_000618 [Parelaphostrongylus tenuis]|uniref:HMG box domain-containing protein n=1 Tax=Parelaphostrongylus tenuis TaxID=148309 RepID=A0AAD5QFP2_PARTN|nr:hypothetical protein KIN20_000618 [Parelaphostrongylus tenuis]
MVPLNRVADQKTINVALAAEWQALSDEERRPFLELATKEREQYQIELKAYEKTEHYRDFLEKKERILRLRKQRRRMGAADSQDDDFDESLDLNETTFVEGTKKRVKNGIRRNKRKASGSDESGVLEYNKKREAKLRAIRHEIGVAEAEKAAMQRTIEKMQAKNLAYEAQAAHDRKIAKEADHIIECWMRVLRGAMGETMKEYNLTTPEETVAFLTRLADGDAPNEDVLQSVKDVIRSASFLLPK